MMLIVYDKTGYINQCIVQSEVALGDLHKRYRKEGIPSLLIDDIDAPEIVNYYVKDPLGPFPQALKKPALPVYGEVRNIKADGIDELVFDCEIPITATIYFDEKAIHEEMVEDGKLEFSTTFPGTYKIFLAAEFPYQTLILTIEATQ